MLTNNEPVIVPTNQYSASISASNSFHCKPVIDYWKSDIFPKITRPFILFYLGEEIMKPRLVIETGNSYMVIKYK